MRVSHHRSLFAALFALAACSSTRPDAPSASSDELNADGKKADLPPLPQVLKFGGPVQTRPLLVPVLYKSDASRQRIVHFYDELAGSDYWGKVTREYGIGELRVAKPIVLDGPAPAKTSDEEIQALLTSMLDGTHPEWPAPDANTTYVFTHPEGTEVDLGGGGGDVCVSALGYHWNVTTPAGPAPYAVVPRCLGGLGSPNTPVGFDSITAVLAHELIEAASDPLPSSADTGGYWDFDANDIAYDFSGYAGEIGDLCEGRAYSFYWDRGSESVVQRIWSNRAAREHKDPCVPKPPGGLVYFNSLARLPDTLTFTFNGATFKTAGVDAPIGVPRPIEVDLFGDGPTNPWSFVPFQHPINGGWGTTGTLDITFDQATGTPGAKVTMTITRKAADGVPSVVAIRSINDTVAYHSYFMVGDPTPPADAGAPDAAAAPAQSQARVRGPRLP